MKISSINKYDCSEIIFTIISLYYKAMVEEKIEVIVCTKSIIRYLYYCLQLLLYVVEAMAKNYCSKSKYT